MSDSEDDFMSDKFLVEAPSASSSKTYSQKRSADQLKAQRRGQAMNKPKLAQLEKERRAEGLNRSLFDATSAGPNSGTDTGGDAPGLSAGGSKAMAMMQKMGWKVGEGLGRQRSPSPPKGTKRDREDDGDEEEAPRRGIGATKPPASKPRIEPIRVSLWAGRKGLSARSPSPPPLPRSSNRDVDYLDPEKAARLGKETDSFREYQRRQFGEKDLERKAVKAREILVGYDKDRDVKADGQFHPLHVVPFDPLSTLPKPLLQLIYPAQVLALSPSPPPSRARSPSPPPIFASREKNLTAAEKVREQMRRDMLSDLEKEGDEDPILKRKRELGLLGPVKDEGGVKVQDGRGADGDWEGVDWSKEISGTKKVLSMDTDTYFTFVLSQLRHEHHFCFWCGYKYGSYDEMEGPGGCPGPEEDDH